MTATLHPSGPSAKGLECKVSKADLCGNQSATGDAFQAATCAGKAQDKFAQVMRNVVDTTEHSGCQLRSPGCADACLSRQALEGFSPLADGEPATPEAAAAALQGLHFAARAARTARNSLRRLVAKLAAPGPGAGRGPGPSGLSSGPSGPSALLDALRAQVHSDVARLQIHGSLALPRPAGAPPERAPGAPLRRGPPAGAADLAPRLRLRLGPDKGVLAVAVSRGGLDPGGTDASTPPCCIAVVLADGAIELWDPMSYWGLQSLDQCRCSPLPQVRTALGECLAVVPLDAMALCLAVPPQGSCPAEMVARLCLASDPPPFVLILARPEVPGTPAECAVHIAAVDASTAGTRALQLRRLYSLPMPAALEVTASSEGLLAGRTGAVGCVLDWQQLRAHRLPGGWAPLALGRSLVVALRAPAAGRGPELLFLEPA